ncbi:MAG: hypothetical protein A2Z91_02725 [Deltaproteobacteria bacterium GWA2_38_16]|nr:MAG: hypothetical protein A2Z91_02725 [Deltaproteobacteria bacterium GWA2_38_16]OGQ02106.1 MAG: hypothetical protein A3D19_09025 [Deltaproteobacteria bacterium RIFCSPHIGHO2_02_FULL_38_15]OGQ32513.1 MAG: hypothetical protein A3A72_02915 [Deltaproteobacteria bacterium RIFCSPLOWO2_01_FULL_38_9]OGQ59655.1 MAG: hypothetical protein A3G92_00145 [Deltaproteobacteria bacterium RIFCSPLOWO2_12_FULL_38_8]HBQ21645.1 hypothetical protein [Deltaproteobacteria bacterium]
MKKIILGVFLMGILLAPLVAQSHDTCEDSFTLQDSYDHACTVEKLIYVDPDEAITACTFRAKPNECTKYLLTGISRDKECYDLAFRYYETEKSTELCTFRTFRCKL